MRLKYVGRGKVSTPLEIGKFYDIEIRSFGDYIRVKPVNDRDGDWVIHYRSLCTLYRDWVSR